MQPTTRLSISLPESTPHSAQTNSNQRTFESLDNEISESTETNVKVALLSHFEEKKMKASSKSMINLKCQQIEVICQPFTQFLNPYETMCGDIEELQHPLNNYLNRISALSDAEEILKFMESLDSFGESLNCLKLNGSLLKKMITIYKQQVENIEHSTHDLYLRVENCREQLKSCSLQMLNVSMQVVYLSPEFDKANIDMQTVRFTNIFFILAKQIIQIAELFIHVGELFSPN